MPNPHLVVGTIRLEPMPKERGGRCSCDDSSLDLLLSSFASYALLNSQGNGADPDRRIGAHRLSWFSAGGADLVVLANLAQLVDDLTAELEHLGSMAN